MRAIRRGRRTSVVFRALLFIVASVCSRICLRYDCFTGSGFFVLSIFNSSRERDVFLKRVFPQARHCSPTPLTNQAR